MPTPYGGSDCTTAKYLPGSAKELYTYDACLDTCVQQKIVDECKCVSQFVQYTEEQFVEGNRTLCGNQSLLVSRANYMNSKWIDELMCSFIILVDSYVLNPAGCENKCFFPCNENIYDTTVSSTHWPHLSYHLSFYKQYVERCACNETNCDETKYRYGKKFKEYKTLWNTFYPNNGDDDADQPTKDNVTQRLQQLSLIEDNFLQINFVIDKNKPFSLVDKKFYTYDVMISSVGGCLSLWLGITVMTAVEFVEFVYSMVLLCKKKCGRNKFRGQPTAMKKTKFQNGQDGQEVLTELELST